jgi:aspartate/methionine/tyrosine aminotransferase
MKLSRRGAVEPFHAMDVLAEATKRRASGRPVISMAVGQPVHPAPEAARQAARRALEIGRIAVTPGSTAGINPAFLPLFDAGDRVAIARPGYPAYRNILAALGIETVEIEVSAENGFTLTPEALQAAGRIDGVLLASPANPTGTVTGRANLAALSAYCRENGIAFISDEIYHGLTFVGEEATALEFGEDAVIINSFSKYYCMTGWRIGWMVLPEKLVRPVERIAQSLYISAPELSQIAAEAALGAEAELNVYRDAYRVNRDFLVKRLPELGFSIASPMDGAFYAYVDVSRFTNDSMAFARRMLAETDVAATPGIDFDPKDGHHTMRFSYAGSFEEMSEAVDRLARWLG